MLPPENPWTKLAHMQSRASPRAGFPASKATIATWSGCPLRWFIRCCVNKNGCGLDPGRDKILNTDGEKNTEECARVSFRTSFLLLSLFRLSLVLRVLSSRP